MILEWKRNLAAFSHHSMAWYWLGQSALTRQRIALSVAVTIDGNPTFTLPDQNDAVVIVSDGSNWFIVAEADFP